MSITSISSAPRTPQGVDKRRSQLTTPFRPGAAAHRSRSIAHFPAPSGSIYVAPPLEQPELSHTLHDILVGGITGLLLFVAFLLLKIPGFL